MTTDQRFPSIPVSDLEGRSLVFPDDIDADTMVAVVAFRRQHQALVDSWVPWLEERQRADPRFAFFEIPCLSVMWTPTRSFIDGGMAAAIKVPTILRRTMTYYGRLARVTGPLGITNTKTITVLALNQAGTVLAQTTGACVPNEAKALAVRLDAAHRDSAPPGDPSQA
jgi:hypothetical protein